ncbi:peptidase [Flavobacterium agricola]|uniref:Peptidase n=1 Tax=Flavobacterium agricola TaxID=2870839 RepID=A0ABY6LX94_9FLAO|nr:peptidase [Flavobacterium agricola]UYW00949.1 peptidase [Flavobacterium agricola]
MTKKLKKATRYKKAFIEKFRIILLNEDSFEEVLSMRLSLLNVFVLLSFSSLILMSFTAALIVFTPIREYIPGYSSGDLRAKSVDLATKADSLEQVINYNNAYINSIRKVLSGDLEYAKINIDSIIKAESENLPDLKLETTEAELNLREELKEKTESK